MITEDFRCKIGEKKLTSYRLSAFSGDPQDVDLNGLATEYVTNLAVHP